MDLWIRSQDRNKLVKIEAGLYVNMPEDFGSGEFSVYTDSTLTNNGLLRLGKYKTKERALEVLDEIQNILQPKMSARPIIEEDMNPKYIHKRFVSNQKEVDIVELNTYVYEIPKE